MCAFYYEELRKENIFKHKHFKMLTSYDNDEFLYPYIDDIDLNDSLKLLNLKNVQLFNKAYYQEPIRGEVIKVPSWRMKEKMKTVSAALVICLNIGVDPPDVEKANQSSKIECWINQLLMSPQKALELIGSELTRQYERWQPRARYKNCLDPTLDEVKKLCLSLRKNAKDDRVLFHYNGHGVPKPTPNGEIWVFNKEFTQYIPLSLYEIQTWMGTPSLFVWDTSNAGMIVQSFLQFETDRENEIAQRVDPNLPNTSMSRIRDSIHLAACSVNETLPMHPVLPADLFTACLTTPIKAALYWYVSQKNLCQLVPGLTLDLLDKIPGMISDRRTMMGELNWIFTAISDTIAWNVLDTELFQKLFRQDLLVASLFRNFLLAERIMRSLDCTPVTSPQLPSTYDHPLWQSWDLALDMCISQLPQCATDKNQKEFQSCGFFTEQIEIFDAWLRYNVNTRSPPEQLPIVLQVLLSQQHRTKALELLCKFLDFGPWAVSATLSVGIFPYVLKLLTTQPRELRPLLTFIWAKILAVDRTCQTELVKDNGHVYFINVIADADVDSQLKVYSLFVLSCIVDNFPSGQESARQNHLISHCIYLINDKQTKDYRNPLVRQWCCICLGLCWRSYPEARWESVRSNAHKALCDLVRDPVAEVRAAAIFALATHIESGKGSEGSDEQTNKINAEIINSIIREYECVPFVRKEIILALYNFMLEFDVFFVSSAGAYIDDEQLLQLQPTDSGVGTNVTTPSYTRSISSISPLSEVSVNTSGVHLQSSYSASCISTGNSTLTKSISGLSLTGAIGSGGGGGGTGASQTILTTTQTSSIKQYNQLLERVWRLIIDYQTDPYPEVAVLATKVLQFFVQQAYKLNETRRNTLHVKQTKQRYQRSGTNEDRRFSESTDYISQSMLNEQYQPPTPPQPPTPQVSQSCIKQRDPTITTEFIQWCSKFFLRPLRTSTDSHNNQQPQQHHLNQIKDLYTTEFLDQHCKILYNNQKRRRKAPIWREPQTMDETIALRHTSIPLFCKFNQYDDQLFIADKESNICVYDYTKQQLKLKFSNLPSQQPSHQQQHHSSTTAPRRVNSKITSFKILNTYYEPYILTGTEDYVIRIFKPDLNRYELSSTNNLVTAFNAFNQKDKTQSSIESGLTLDWDESRNYILCGGDVKFIRIWDMNRELYMDYNTDVSSCVSCISSNDTYFVAGFGDGKLKLFDLRRQSTSGSSGSLMTATGAGTSGSKLGNILNTNFNFEHNSYVMKVQIQKNSEKLISASTNGDISIIDLRMFKMINKISLSPEVATVVECHPFNELIAVANSNQTVKVYDFKSKELAAIKHHEGFLGKRIASVSCIDWNCYKNELLFGSQDQYISVFACRDNQSYFNSNSYS